MVRKFTAREKAESIEAHAGRDARHLSVRALAPETPERIGAAKHEKSARRHGSALTAAAVEQITERYFCF